MTDRRRKFLDELNAVADSEQSGLRQELDEARAALAEHDRRWQQRADHPCGEHHRPPECTVDEQGRSLSVCGCPWEDVDLDIHRQDCPWQQGLDEDGG